MMQMMLPFRFLFLSLAVDAAAAAESGRHAINRANLNSRGRKLYLVVCESVPSPFHGG
jgi:hypothetical protein